MTIKMFLFFLIFEMGKTYSQGTIGNTNSLELKSKNINATTVDSNSIVYFLPTEVEELLRNKIQKGNDTVYFRLEAVRKGIFRISILPISKVISDEFAIMTNRHLCLNNKFYPLVFDYDNIFASSESGIEIYHKSLKGEEIFYKKNRIIHHFFYYIEFARNGVIMKEEYEGTLPEN